MRGEGPAREGRRGGVRRVAREGLELLLAGGLGQGAPRGTQR